MNNVLKLYLAKASPKFKFYKKNRLDNLCGFSNEKIEKTLTTNL